MATINQLVRKPHKKVENQRAGVGCAARQKSGVCTRVYTTTPKPNSALRKVARIRLTNSLK